MAGKTMKNKYAAGAKAENDLKKLYERLGYYTVRSAGSKGAIDLQGTRLGGKTVECPHCMHKFQVTIPITHGIQVQRKTKLAKKKQERLLAVSEFGITPVEAFKKHGEWQVKILKRV